MDPKDPNYVPPIDQADRRARHRRRLHEPPIDPAVRSDGDPEHEPEAPAFEEDMPPIASSGWRPRDPEPDPPYPDSLYVQMDEDNDVGADDEIVDDHVVPPFESSRHPLRSAELGDATRERVELERLTDDQPLLSLFERLLLAELRMARQQLDRLADALEEGVAHR